MDAKRKREQDLLKKKLSRLAKIFNLKSLLNTDFSDKDSVTEYYEKSFWAYSIFHNPSAIHMGLSYDGKFKKDDFKGQARFVEECIRSISGSKKQINILELGGGRGANTLYLAKKFPEANFMVTDLTDRQLVSARKRSKRYRNVSVKSCDYHDLSEISKIKYDLIFMVETLCHSGRKAEVAKQVHSALTNNGYFLVFDGYKTIKKKDMGDIERKASELVEKGMAVEDFEYHETAKSEIEKSGFSITEDLDLSEHIKPSLLRLERRADFFHTHPRITNILLKIWPPEFAYNSISAALMRPTTDAGIFGYYATVFQKE